MTTQTTQTTQTALADLLETLREAVPPGSYDELTFGDLVDLDAGPDAGPDDPVLVEEGWYAECDGAEVAYPWAMSAIEAAEQYVEDGDWGEPGEGDPWVDVYTYRKGWVIDIDTREVTAITIDRDRQRIALHLDGDGDGDGDDGAIPDEPYVEVPDVTPW